MCRRMNWSEKMGAHHDDVLYDRLDELEAWLENARRDMEHDSDWWDLKRRYVERGHTIKRLEAEVARLEVKLDAAFRLCALITEQIG